MGTDWRDNDRDNDKDLEPRYQDHDPDKDLSYYYVRAVQSDGAVAWSSPTWINLK